jgi:Ca2+-binding RTX toxin-like protein
MAKHVVNGVRTKILEIDKSGDEWIVAKGGAIRIGDQFFKEPASIYESSAFSNSRIVMDGRISGFNATAGIVSNGDSVDISIGKTGSILSEWGIDSTGDDARIINAGEIIGVDQGIYATGLDASVRNSGLVTAQRAVFLAGEGTEFINQKSGVVGGNLAISTIGEHQIRIVNSGDIYGSNYSILANDDTFNNFDGSVHVINKGRIFNDIYLGAGDSILDTLKGKILTDAIEGGDGDDTMKTSNANYVLQEELNEGFDQIHATVTYALTENVEGLTLLGKKNIDGTGNELSNIINGNSGNNQLVGGNGVDLLRGNRGDDILSGGGTDGDIDFFIFTNGCDQDRIVDFENGLDVLSLGGYDGIDDFSDLDIVQEGADLLVTLGAGDVVRILNLNIGQFTSADVFIA